MTAYNLDSSALAITYDVLSDSQFGRGSLLVEKLDVKPDYFVLDIGCGTGRLGLHVLENKLDIDGKLIGIDPLEERIKVAEEKNRYSNGEFRVGSAEDLSFLENDSIDIVYLSAVYHWIPDKGKALSEIFRVLKPGGKVGLTTGARELAYTGLVRKVLDRVLSGPRYRDRVKTEEYILAIQGTTATELIERFSEAGLELASLNLHRNVTRHLNGERFVDFLESSTFGNYLAHVPQDLRADARRELVVGLEAHNSGEGIDAVGHSITAIAQKPRNSNCSLGGHTL